MAFHFAFNKISHRPSFEEYLVLTLKELSACNRSKQLSKTRLHKRSDKESEKHVKAKPPYLTKEK